MKYLAQLLNGYAFDSRTYIEDGIPIKRIGDTGGEIAWDEVKRVPRDFIAGLKRYLLKKHDILLALMGATIGKSSSYDYDDLTLLNQRAGIIRANKIDQSFLRCLIQSDAFCGVIDFLCYGGARENIGREEVGGISVRAPSMVEQQAIADFLDCQTAKIDALVDKAEEAMERLREYRTTLIAAAVTGKIDVRGAQRPAEERV